MTITIDLPEDVEARIRQVAMHRKMDTEAVVREVVLERFPDYSRESGLHNPEEALAEIDAMPGTGHLLDWDRLHTADFYEEE